jgi:hypothetical protein
LKLICFCLRFVSFLVPLQLFLLLVFRAFSFLV